MRQLSFRLLEINLSDRTIAVIELPSEWIREYIGGRGLGTRMLWERTKQEADPLAPEAEMYILTGPLTGVIPGGAHICLTFKSPLTGNTIGFSVTGAQWGPELKYAGYDGIILKGKSLKPVYLMIKDDVVEIKDAGHLWGTTTWQTQQLIKEELKDDHFKVLAIGPAGENLVSFASIGQEQFRAAARCGSGTVWGSKGLKAVAVRGTNPVRTFDLPGVIKARGELEKLLLSNRTNHPRGYELVRYGNSISLTAHNDEGRLVTKNYQEGYFEGINEVGGLKYDLRYYAKSRSCFGCPLGCMKLGMVRDGIFAGNIVCPDFDSTANIGPGCNIPDLGSMVYLSRWADEQGLDATSLGNITGFAMECYEKGILSLEDLDGIKLEWGNTAAILELWRKIVNREGIGDILAKGVKYAAQAIGNGADKLAMHCKGVEFPGFVPQGGHKKGLQYAISDRGPCHHYGSTIDEQNQRVWADSLTVCSWQRRLVDPQIYMDLLKTVMGWDIELTEWDVTAERMLLLARAYNIREGIIPEKDDILPERVHTEPLTKGKKAGSVYPLEKFIADRLRWYEERGCDATGVPKIEHLEEIGLAFTIPVINKFTRGLTST
ncbi:MAG: aldehyde:ferredoxin oxidoreductase [Peptococcaceae bacterium BICA1-8]|nr:MAG: aldehyde:ferredoxin oxidoreductase [Peptococcaceae bacterium BICA1-8]